ncbi:hypothetical protein GCM10010524_30270 [Streptomyces mexicanus]
MRTPARRPPGIAVSGLFRGPFSDVTPPLDTHPGDRHIELRSLNRVAQKATKAVLSAEVGRWRNPEW